jgi:hypothetical protein
VLPKPEEEGKCLKRRSCRSHRCSVRLPSWPWTTPPSWSKRPGKPPPGCVVAACETLILDQGRQLLRDSLAATLQDHIDQSEKRGARPNLHLRSVLP